MPRAEKPTIDGSSQVTVAHMAVAVMPIQAGEQQGGVPGDQPGQPQEDDARRPAQVGKGKGQGCISCTDMGDTSFSGQHTGVT